MRQPKLLPVADCVAETKRLLAGWASGYPAEKAESGGRMLSAWRARLEDGTLRGHLLIGPQDEGVALVIWWEMTPVGGRGALYLAPGFRNGATLDSLVTAIAEQLGPPAGLWDDSLFLSPSEVASVLQARGFIRRARVDMVYPLTKELPRLSPLDPAYQVRPIRMEDRPAIAAILEHAYANDPGERALFAQSTDTAAEAERTATELLTGLIGTWIPSASFGAFDGPTLAAATLVNELEGPLITEVVVEPDHRRRGLARRLIAESLAALRRLGEGAPRLVVTRSNAPALELYRSVGFEIQPATEGGIWINRRTFGIPPPAGG